MGWEVHEIQREIAISTRFLPLHNIQPVAVHIFFQPFTTTAP